MQCCATGWALKVDSLAAATAQKTGGYQCGFRKGAHRGVNGFTKPLFPGRC